MTSVAGGWQMNLEELVAGTGGRVVSQIDRVYLGLGSDSRADLSGKIFFALKGDNFDAHDFLSQAVSAGAAALVVHRLPDSARGLDQRVTIVQVADTLMALQDLARFWRRRCKARVLGVTGTNGKTTTKEFTAAILGSQLRVQYSKGSFNNHWGVPISLLSIESDHQAAVIEMGMNHLGELKDLSRIVEPDVVLCTMVGRGHLEGVGSIEGVAQAKSEIYEYAPARAVRIFNLENEHTAHMYRIFGQGMPDSQVLTFAGADFVRSHDFSSKIQNRLNEFKSGVMPVAGFPRLPDVSFEVAAVGLDELLIRGQIREVPGEVSVPVFGRQNITNLMAASAFALACGLTPEEIWRALPLCRTAWGRNQWVKLESGARALFDAYNANPESMRAAVENFSSIRTPEGGRKIALLAEMRELGHHAPDLHRELGAQVGQADFDAVCFIGPSWREFEAGVRSTGFSKTLVVSMAYEENLALSVCPVLNQSDLVLLKGSRGMQLEKVLAELKPIDFRAKT